MLNPELKPSQTAEKEDKRRKLVHVTLRVHERLKVLKKETGLHSHQIIGRALKLYEAAMSQERFKYDTTTHVD